MEKVYIELDWYDGPRKGIADFNGVPHRFVAHFDAEKGYDDTFSLFPVNAEELDLEIEQWKIFTEWNKRYEAGVGDTESHPGHGGISTRWDEVERLLQSSRTIIPQEVITATATFKRNEQERRYEVSGPDYSVAWHVIGKET